MKINLEFVPETLEWCKQNYTPPIKKFINCKEFGKCDGMDGSCHWCLHITPYQWEMCSDESHIQSILRSNRNKNIKTREDAIEWIQKYKQKCFNND